MSSSIQKKNYLNEAKKLLEIIEETKISKKEDWIFVESIKARCKVDGFVSEPQIFWLRDIKDRQLQDE